MPACATVSRAELFTSLRQACRKVHRALYQGQIRSWDSFAAALREVGVEHVLIKGTAPNGKEVWSGLLVETATNRVAPCFSILKGFDTRALVETFGQHPAWCQDAAPRYIVSANDDVLVEIGNKRFRAGFDISELPPGEHDLELPDGQRGRVFVHDDRTRIHYGPNRVVLKVIEPAPSQAGDRGAVVSLVHSR